MLLFPNSWVLQKSRASSTFLKGTETGLCQLPLGWTSPEVKWTSSKRLWLEPQLVASECGWGVFGTWVSMTTHYMPGWARKVHSHQVLTTRLWENYYYSQGPQPVAGRASIGPDALLLQHSCSFHQITLWPQVQNTTDILGICLTISGTSDCWLASRVFTFPCFNLYFLRLLQRLNTFCSLVI